MRGAARLNEHQLHAMKHHGGSTDGICSVVNELLALRLKVEQVRFLVEEQAEDEGLWIVAATAPEAYLQDSLRKLHHYVEKPIFPRKA